MRNIIAWFITALLVVAFAGQRVEGSQIGEAPLAPPEIPRITANEARKLYEQGKLILANAHGSGAEFEKTRLIGAISIPAAEARSLDPQIPEDVILAFYCM